MTDAAASIAMLHLHVHFAVLDSDDGAVAVLCGTGVDERGSAYDLASDGLVDVAGHGEYRVILIDYLLDGGASDMYA